jgi:hypothetical protein
MDWFKGKFTGKPSYEKWGNRWFPVKSLTLGIEPAWEVAGDSRSEKL